MTSVSIVSWHHHHYYHHCVFNQLCKIYGNENKWTGIVVSVLRIVIWTCVYLKVSSIIFFFINRKKKNIKIQILVCNFVFARPMFRAQGCLYLVISSVSETTKFSTESQDGRNFGSSRAIRNLHSCYNFALVLHEKCIRFQPIRRA